MLILAYFGVFLMGLYHCFKEVYIAWTVRHRTDLNKIDKQNHILKAVASFAFGCLGIIALVDVVIQSGVL